MIRADSIRRTRARRSSRIFSIAGSASSRKTGDGPGSSESPLDAVSPPFAPRKLARGLEEPAGHSRRGGPPERFPRKEDERRAKEKQREERHDRVVGERCERQGSPERPRPAADDAHREDREPIADRRLRESVHSEQLLREGVLEKPERAADE